VEIYLYEQDVEAAWREAQEGGCANALWLKLALDREAEHPGDAAPVFLKLAQASVAAVQDGRYENAVRLLVITASTMKRIGQSPRFLGQLELLRAQYKLKRNFLKLIEENRKFLYL
jgi:hypothetical protein